ncbi:MAG: peptidase M23 [Rhodobacteraceae bacterium]|nr:MAG: peptidase M23 [Paracoccaceae bacterium]
MRRMLLSILAALALSGAAHAEGEAGDLAREAAEALGDAAELLAEVETADDRIDALTETIRAYEAGLSTMREGLRQAALSERDVALRLGAEDAELGALLALLQKVTRAGQGRAVFHPSGAVDAVRGGLLASALVPALEEKTSALERDLNDLAALRTIQEAGIATLDDGLARVREARLMLSQAMSERTDLPRRVATDDAAMEALINSSETLAAFADSLVLVDDAPISARRDWSWPVAGQIVRGFEEADAAGVRRPGWLIAASAEALVTSPSDATVRYAGDMPSSGPALILEAAPGTLMILTGHGQSFVERGEIVSEGSPIALMGGGERPAQEKLNESALLGGQSRAETLYIEIRQGQAPVNPAAFLRPTEE